jgi:hypothetical protein
MSPSPHIAAWIDAHEDPLMVALLVLASGGVVVADPNEVPD